MNIAKHKSESDPMLPAGLLLELENHPKMKSGSPMVKPVDSSRQPKMIFVSKHLRESLKTRLSDSVKKGKRVPHIVNIQRSQSLDTVSIGKSSTSLNESPQTNGHFSDIQEFRTFSTPRPDISATVKEGSRKPVRNGTTMIYTSVRKEHGKSGDDSVPWSVSPEEAPLRTSSVKKRNSTNTEEKPIKNEIREKLEMLLKQHLTPPAPPLSPTGLNSFKISGDNSQSLKSFNKTVSGETAQSKADSQSKGDNSASLPSRKTKRKVTKWSDKPKTVRASIKPGSVDELKKMFMKLGEENFRPSVIKKNRGYFHNVFTTHGEAANIFLNSSFDESSKISKTEEEKLKTNPKKYEQNWAGDMTAEKSSFTQGDSENERVFDVSVSTDKDEVEGRDLSEYVQTGEITYTQSQATENGYVGHISASENINNTGELSERHERKNFEEENSGYGSDRNEWPPVEKPDFKENNEFAEMGEQRNSVADTTEKTILIDNNEDQKPDEQLDSEDKYHVTAFVTSAAGKTDVERRENYTSADGSRATSPLIEQTNLNFSKQEADFERSVLISDNENNVDNSESVVSEGLNSNSDSENMRERKISEINSQAQNMSVAMDSASFIPNTSNRYSTATTDNNKNEKVYIVQDNVGDLYVVEDITDTTRETTTIMQPGRMTESAENESAKALNSTNSSFHSFDFGGADSGGVSVETGVDRSKAEEVISTLFNDITGNNDFSIMEYQNTSSEHGNVDLGNSITTELISGDMAAQREIQTAVTEQKDSVLHEDKYEKTVLNIVTDSADKPLWTEKTTDTQTCAWLENKPDYDHGDGKKYVSSLSLSGKSSGTASDSMVIPEPDYSNEMSSLVSYSAEKLQNESDSRSLVPISSTYNLPVATQNQQVTHQSAEQTSSAIGEKNETETESEITITTRTTAVVGEMVDMHIGIPPDLQSSVQDVSSTSTTDNVPRRSSSIIKLRTKSPQTVSPRSDSLNNSQTQISDITEINDYRRSASPTPHSSQIESSVVRTSGNYVKSSPERINNSPYPQSDRIEIVNGFDAEDDDGRRYRVVTNSREYEKDKSSYRKRQYYEEYVSKNSPEREKRRSPTNEFYTSVSSPIKPERYVGETDSQYSSKGTSSGVTSVGDDQSLYKISHVELSPTRREPHLTTYRVIESPDRDANYYSVDRRDSGEDLWRVNTSSVNSKPSNTSTNKVYVEHYSEDKPKYRIVRSLSEEKLNSRNKRLSSGFLSGDQSDSDEGAPKTYKTVKTFQITNKGKPQQSPRRRRRTTPDFDGENRSACKYRVSNIDENTLLEKEWQRRLPDDGRTRVFRVKSPPPSGEPKPSGKRRVIPDDRDDSRKYIVRESHSPKRHVVSSSNNKSASSYYTKSSPSHFDSGYFDDSNTYWAKSPSHRSVVELNLPPRRSSSVEPKTRDSLYRVVNVKSEEDLNTMRRSRRHSPPARYRSGSLSSDSDDDHHGKYYITPAKAERKSLIRDVDEPRRRLTKEKNIYYVHRSPSPESVHLKRVRSLSPDRKYRISNHVTNENETHFVTSSPPMKTRDYVVYDEDSLDYGLRRTTRVPDAQTYRTEKTIVLQPSRDMSPRIQHKGGRYFSQNSGLSSMDQTIDSGTGTEIASSDNEGNGETIRARRYERVEEIYEVKKEPQYVDVVDDVDGSLKVQRGKILIQNQMDPSKDEDDFDDNINVFDNSFHLQKDNPLYQSDPDIYRDNEDYDNGNALEREVTQDITFETVNKITQTHREKQVVPQTSQKTQLSTLLLSRLANIDSKDVRQTIDVQHKNEEIYGDIDFIHADGQRTGSANTNNFDAVNENIGLTLKDGKAFVTIKVVAERIVPIDYEFNVWRKSSAIVTRQIEIDLLANEQRRRLYNHVMENAGPQGAIAGSLGPEVPPRFQDDMEKTLSSVETLKLFSQILNVAEGQPDNDEAEYYTRQEQRRLPSTSAFDILY